jgi:UDPglucose 6-dehydrogenase
MDVAKDIGRNLNGYKVVVTKSTVPVGTNERVEQTIKEKAPKSAEFDVVSNPEFLREGTAIEDMKNTNRTVIGTKSERALKVMRELYKDINAPMIECDLRSAEMIKYASNALLATKISFINEIANICEALGADVKEVAAGMGYDKRIGPLFLDAGLGWGGSCFPKDVKALAFMAAEKGRHPQLLNAVMDINYDRRKMVVQHLEGMLGGLHGKVIGLLGLAFKPNTDDMREAPSIEIAQELTKEGATVRTYDPIAMENARTLLPAVELFEDPYQMAEGCDALVVVTEWNEFKQLDLERVKGLMKQPVIFDGRNIYDPAYMKFLGFTYRAFGRGYDVA